MRRGLCTMSAQSPRDYAWVIRWHVTGMLSLAEHWHGRRALSDHVYAHSVIALWHVIFLQHLARAGSEKSRSTSVLPINHVTQMPQCLSGFVNHDYSSISISKGTDKLVWAGIWISFLTHTVLISTWILFWPHCIEIGTIYLLFWTVNSPLNKEIQIADFNMKSWPKGHQSPMGATEHVINRSVGTHGPLLSRHALVSRWEPQNVS